MSNCFRLFDRNYIDADFVNALTATSAQTNFPLANIQNFSKRGKVHRTSGFWEITALNNVIRFRETTAVDLDATLTVSDFTTTTAFLLEIKTALELVGASVYTVSLDALTNRIVITSDGAGGGGLLELQTSDVAFTAASILGFSTAIDLSGALTYTADLLKISTGEHITIDAGTAVNPQAFVIGAARNTPLRFSPTANIKLLGHETSNFTTPTFSQTLTFNSKLMALVYDPLTQTGLHTEGLKIWRLEYNDNSNVNAFIELGFLYLGETFSLSSAAVQFPLSQAQVDRSIVIESEGGQYFATQREKRRQYQFTINFINTTEKEELEFLFDTFGIHSPMLMLFDADAVFSSVFNEELRLVQFAEPPQFVLTRPNIFTTSFSLIEVL